MQEEIDTDKSSKQIRREKDRRRRKREQTLKTPPKKWNISFKTIFVVAFYLWIMTEYTILTVNRYRLADYGERQMAYVYSRTKGHRSVYVHYYFKVDGCVYKGHTTNDSRAQVGDSLMIRYLPSNPNINDSANTIENKLLFR